jgi:ribosomal-protein-alanine N-acetyltransferase
LDPILETPRLELRPLVPSDADALYAYRRQAEVMQYMGGADHSIEDTRAALEKYCRYQRMYGFSRWAMFLKETGEFVGDSGLLPMDDSPEFELGYRLAKDFWAMGLATECGGAWLDAAFTRFGLRTVIAFADERHTASLRVMQKLGMNFDKPAHIDGMDCCVYRANRGIYPLGSHL